METNAACILLRGIREGGKEGGGREGGEAKGGAEEGTEGKETKTPNDLLK